MILFRQIAADEIGETGRQVGMQNLLGTKKGSIVALECVIIRSFLFQSGRGPLVLLFNSFLESFSNGLALTVGSLRSEQGWKSKF